MLTIEEIKKDIVTYQKRLENPAGLSEQQIAVYRQAIIEATQLLQQMQAAQHGPVTTPPPPPQPPIEPLKRTTPPPPANPQLSESFKLSESSPSTTPSPLEGRQRDEQPTTPVTVRTPGAQKTARPIPATIHADIETNPYDPVLTIVWSDGYQFFGTESIIKSQFISRMKNLAEMKDVKDPHRRQKQMWAWDTPWRCLGLLQALIYFYGGQAPTIQQLGIDQRRVSNLFIELFNYITHTALTTDSGKTTIK